MKPTSNNPLANKISQFGKRSRAIADKINKTQQMGILGVLLIAGGAATLAIMANPTESTPEMVNDWDNGDEQVLQTSIKVIPVETMPEEYLHIWADLRNRGDVIPGTVRGIVYSVHENEPVPYAVILLGNNVMNGIPLIVSLPKAMMTEAGWETVKTAKIKTAFATKWKYTIPGPPKKEFPKVGLPLEKTITDAQGRSIDVTITAIKNGKLEAKRKGETKTMQIDISKLSADDQTFLKEKVDPNKINTTGPTVLVMGFFYGIEEEEYLKILRKANFQITIMRIGTRKNYNKDEIIKNEIKDFKAEFAKYDVIWNPISSISPENRNFAQIADDLKKIVVVSTSAGLTKEQYLTHSGYDNPENPYCKIDENFIIVKTDNLGKKVTYDTKMVEKACDAVEQLLRDRKK